MASKAAFKRLSKEYLAMQSAPTPYIQARPVESNILEWHYVLDGPPDTPYEGGQYHGRLRFPPDYPYKPPAIQMVTPSGRFQTNTNICMSMSNFHPDSWNPAWSVSTILTGMLSFMVEEEATTGSIRASAADRRALARRSHKANLTNRHFRELFPELCTAAAAATAQSRQSELRKRTGPPAAAVPATRAADGQTGSGWMAGLSRRWVILLVVLVYFVSKAISRLLAA